MNMSNDKDELSKELMEAVKDTSKMAHVETKTTKSEVALKLKCGKCGAMEEVPTHHDMMMDIMDDGKTLQCAHEECNEQQAVPTHCDAVMQPFITGN